MPEHVPISADDDADVHPDDDEWVLLTVGMVGG